MRPPQACVMHLAATASCTHPMCSCGQFVASHPCGGLHAPRCPAPCCTHSHTWPCAPRPWRGAPLHAPRPPRGAPPHRATCVPRPARAAGGKRRRRTGHASRPRPAARRMHPSSSQPARHICITNRCGQTCRPGPGSRPPAPRACAAAPPSPAPAGAAARAPHPSAARQPPVRVRYADDGVMHLGGMCWVLGFSLPVTLPQPH